MERERHYLGGLGSTTLRILTIIEVVKPNGFWLDMEFWNVWFKCKEKNTITLRNYGLRRVVLPSPQKNIG
ncbi:MAG: hypothetical protein JXQ76_13325 [Campylobacterales bacterium]|nr:hypothetical protein [Campylobacterales bacterium]